MQIIITIIHYLADSTIIKVYPLCVQINAEKIQTTFIFDVIYSKNDKQKMYLLATYKKTVERSFSDISWQTTTATQIAHFSFKNKQNLNTLTSSKNESVGLR